MIPTRYIFLATVFLTGAAVLVLEVAAVRVLSPHYGSSLYVFSSVLTTILAALSIGYWYGGRLVDRKQSVPLLYRTIMNAGVLVLVLLAVAKFLLPNTAHLLSPTTGPLVFSLILFFVPAVLLGMVSPYIVKLQAALYTAEQLGQVVGQVFFWGTAGSIVGSLLSGFVLIPIFGVTTSILVTGGTLIAIGLIAPILMETADFKKYQIGLLVLALITASVSVASETVFKQQFIYAEEGIYSSIVIRDIQYRNQPVRLLMRDNNSSSGVNLQSKATVFDYTKFPTRLDELTPNAERVLVLGGGAYTVPRTLTHDFPELQIDVVELEPRLYDLSQEYFDLSDTEMITNFAMDARVYLRDNETKYDLIFIDLFNTNHTIPFHLATTEFFTEVHKDLTDDGIMMMNVIAAPSSTAPSLSGSVAVTINDVFENTTAYALRPNLAAVQNIMFVARKSDLPITFAEPTGLDIFTGNDVARTPFSIDRYHRTEEMLLTDDRAPIELLTPVN